MKSSPDSLILMGEIFWREDTSDEALAGMGVQRGEWVVGQEQLLGIFEESGARLVEMVMATGTE